MELEAQWWTGQLAADIHQALRYKVAGGSRAGGRPRRLCEAPAVGAAAGGEGRACEAAPLGRRGSAGLAFVNSELSVPSLRGRWGVCPWP